MNLVSPQILVFFYNVWLVLGFIPGQYLEGETILIPKGEDLSDPANYRPIPMASRVTRVLHKIVASRLTAKVPLDPRQKAFMPVDGCADNVFLLDNIIRGPSGRENRCAWPS